MPAEDSTLLPFDKGWSDAETAGIDLGMTALRKGDVVLALFAGDVPRGQVFAIGLAMSPDEIGEIRSRLPADVAVAVDKPHLLEFRDRYGIAWQISLPGNAFRTAGDFAGRWLEI